MRQALSFNLHGRDWSRLYLWFWGPLFLLMVLSVVAPEPKGADSAALMGSLFISLAISFLSMMVQSYFTVPILRTWLPRLAVQGKNVEFRGDTTTYLLLNVQGFLLSVATLGLFLPWYAKSVAGYLARETRYEGEPFQFEGNPRQLLLQMLLGFLIAMVVAVAVAASIVAGQKSPSMAVLEIVTTVVALLAFSPLLFVYYRWLVHFSSNRTLLRWNTKFLHGATTFFLQMLLTVVTLGLWWPGAVLVLYRYGLRHTNVTKDGQVIANLDFEGQILEGWRLLWGQALLTLVTLGFYGAWSSTRVARWIAERTIVVSEAPGLERPLETGPVPESPDSPPKD